MTPVSVAGGHRVVRELSQRLLDAESRRRAIPAFVADNGIDVDAAYAIQAESIDAKLGSGDRVIGRKLGLASKAKQQAMGVDEPIYGVLLASHVLTLEDPVDLARFIHPRVEPELVVRTAHDLEGPGVTTVDVFASVEAVGIGLEVIDSRFEDFAFTLPDVVADNTSAAGVVLGNRWLPPAALPDLSLVGSVLDVDGRVEATASGAAVLGSPLAAVASSVNWLGRRGERLDAGSVVLTGGLVDATPLVPGRHVTARFGHLGSISLRVGS